MSLKIDGALLLAGAGNMGVAMLAGWLEGGLDPKQIVVQDPSPPPRGKELLGKHGIAARATVASLPTPPAVIVVAVKPQVMDEVFPPLAKLAGQGTVVLSIAAGRTISGSGPAYVFYLAECLAEAGVKAGLAPELAQKLARATVAGSGELLHRSDLGADVLRQNVTSPGGTTFAALQVLMAETGGLPELM